MTVLSYTQNMEVGAPGLITGIREGQQIIGYRNAAAEAAQSVSIAPGTPANTTAYNILITHPLTGVVTTVTYTSDGTATAAEIQAGLIAAVQASSGAYSLVIPTAGASDAVVLTARQLNTPITIAVSGGGTGYAATTTAPVTASAIAPGLLIVRNSGDGEGEARLPSSGTNTRLGISVAAHNGEKTAIVNGQFVYPRTYHFPVMQVGGIWAVTEDAIGVDVTSMFYRHTASGANTAIGCLSANSGTGKAALSAGIRTLGASRASTLSPTGLIVPVYVSFV